MGYIDDNLAIGESVVYRTRLHWIIFFWPVFLVALAILFFSSRSSDVSQFAFFILFLGAIPWGILSYIDYNTSEFGVSNKRVLIKVGFIRRASLEILLDKVESIQVNQSVLGRMLNYGTIIVRGTGGSHSPFHSINEPIVFRKKIQEQIESIKLLR